MKKAIALLIISTCLAGWAQTSPGPPPAPAPPAVDYGILEYILSFFPFAEPAEAEPKPEAIPMAANLAVCYAQDLSSSLAVDYSENLATNTAVNLGEDLSTNLAVCYGQNLAVNLGVAGGQNLGTPTRR